MFGLYSALDGEQAVKQTSIVPLHFLTGTPRSCVKQASRRDFTIYLIGWALTPHIIAQGYADVLKNDGALFQGVKGSAV